MSKKAKRQTLVVVRHAHRNKLLGRAVDNGLSAKGRAQAKDLFDYFCRRYGAASPRVISSPKKRCQETVAPMARIVGQELMLDPLLDEQGKGESQKKLKARISRFVKNWKKENESLTITCTHGDIIPLLLKKLIGVSVDLEKGGWAEIEATPDGAQLRWVVQQLKP